jgi:hypothetical protein
LRDCIIKVDIYVRKRGINMKNNFQEKIDEMLVSTDLESTEQEYVIDIEEAVVSSFRVKAKSMEEAMEIAEEKYWNNEFVVGPGADVAARQMRASNEDFSEQTEWTEF